MSASAATNERHDTSTAPAPAWLVWAQRLRWVGLAGAALALGRYLMQAVAVGGVNIYTETAREFYLTDPVLGWTLTDESWFWLGLDLAIPLVLAAGAVFILVALGKRFTEQKPRIAMPTSLFAIALAVALPWIPLFAVASGLPPDGASPVIPTSDEGFGAAAGAFPDGVPGTYGAVQSDANAVVASVTAGGETFDVTFGQPDGQLTFDPTQIASDTSATFTATVQDLDAGIELRSKHTREYLQAEQFPTIEVSLSEIEETRVSETGDTVFFDARGAVSLMGETLVLPVSGKLLQADRAAREQLGLDAEHVYVLHASLTIDLSKTPLKTELEAFDENDVPVTVRIVLEKI